MTLTMDFFETLQEDHKMIVSFNVRSIRNKILSIESDRNFQKANVLVIVDTRYGENEVDQLSCFVQPPIVSSYQRVALGQIVYHKENVISQAFKTIEIDGLQQASITFMKIRHFWKQNFTFRNIFLFFIYIVPNCPNTVYEKVMDFVEQHCDSSDDIVMGDFNRNPTEMSRSFKTSAKKLHLIQHIQVPTHIQKNILDHIWTNLDSNLIYANTFSTLVRSDHQPIFLAVRSE